jgi:hypothetical protein
MPAYCHDPRPPLFAAGKDDDQPRLPEPSPPPWLNCSTLPNEFYRPIFTFRAGRDLAFVATVPPIAPGEVEP